VQRAEQCGIIRNRKVVTSAGIVSRQRGIGVLHGERVARVVLLKPISSMLVLGPRLRGFESIVNVMVFAEVVTVPDPGEAVSQLGVVIEYFTLPKVVLRG
jgi:hypothetical protein